MDNPRKPVLFNKPNQPVPPYPSQYVGGKYLYKLRINRHAKLVERFNKLYNRYTYLMERGKERSQKLLMRMRHLQEEMQRLERLTGEQEKAGVSSF